MLDTHTRPPDTSKDADYRKRQATTCMCYMSVCIPYIACLIPLVRCCVGRNEDTRVQQAAGQIEEICSSAHQAAIVEPGEL